MKRLTACALGAAALCGAALAQPAPPKGPAGSLAHGVFLSPAGEPFRPTAAAPDPLKTWFDQADAKHLGYLDREAFRADAVNFFHKLDENGDGIISGVEVYDYEHKLVPELSDEAEGRIPGLMGDRDQGGSGGQGGQTPGGQGQGGHGGHRHGGGDGSGQTASGQGGGERGDNRLPQSRISQLIGEPEPVADADYAFDARITLEEWLKATDQRFDILDEAHDGKLTLTELRARFKPLPK